MERAIRKEQIVKSDGRVAIELMILLQNDTMGKFVGFFRDIVGEHWGRRVNDDVWL